MAGPEQAEVNVPKPNVESANDAPAEFLMNVLLFIAREFKVK
jgi:hypothetical protein